MGVRRSEWDSLKPKEDGIASYKERMAQRRLQELKRKKPHLFTVPQKHPRGKWCKHLMEMTSSLERWLDHECWRFKYRRIYKIF